MANELSTTVKPQSKPMMKSMKPPLPSVLSPAVLAAVFLDWVETSSIFLETANSRDFMSVTVCVMGAMFFSMACAVAALACNSDSIFAVVSL